MGILKQLLIDKQDELGNDFTGFANEQELIEDMEVSILACLVEDYMQSEAYYKEHMDQEKKIANSLTHPETSAKI